MREQLKTIVRVNSDIDNVLFLGTTSRLVHYVYLESHFWGIPFA